MDSEASERMLASLLPFQRRMVQELIEEDGLCVLSAGMGWQKIVAVLLRLQMERLREPEEHGVLLVIGSTDWQRQMISQELLRLDPSLARPPEPEEGSSTSIVEARAADMPQEITNESLAQARIDLYRSKACLFVTTRILVVDMLNKRLVGKEIAGIIVMNAHRVTDSSQDGFAVRLFRESNRSGFVRAFSDQPTSFTAGFAKIEKVMKALFIRRLHLWPRFEASAKEVLDAIEKDIQVVELEVEMTPSMSEIYQSIAELLDFCIKDLRKANRIDTSELDVQAGLFKSFDDIIRRQLDKVWHTVTSRTKQIVNDLRTLRTLAEHLLSFDAVTFLAYLDNLRITEGMAAVWLFHDAAHTLFDQAKRRVYHLQSGALSKKKASKSNKRVKPEDEDELEQDEGPKGDSSSGTTIHPILEPLPKWGLVCDIMEEIQNEREQMSKEASTSGREKAAGPVLIVALQMRTCLQLKSVLQAGGSKDMMQKLYSEYLLQRLSGKRGEKQAQARGRGGRGHGHRGRGGQGTAMRLEQLRAQRLLGDRMEQQALMSVAESLADAENGGRQGRGRGRARGSGKGGRSRPSKRAKPAESPEKEEADDAKADKPDGEEASTPRLLQDVFFCPLDSKDVGVLWEVEPSYVISYDPDIAFVRQLEVYKAERPLRFLKVYNLWYTNSLEFDRYVTTLQREEKVFEDMIQQKAYIVLPDLTQDFGQLVSREPRERPSSMHPDVVLGLPSNERNASALTRRGGSRLTPRAAPRQVVVDMREFMSSLPCVLYQQGLELVPVTLEVGDYILSPEMCIERKSLSDLRGSFISGRLYHQAEAMSRNYKLPILLIEFERDQAFALHGPSDITPEIQANSLISKLTLLTLHFPRLRIIWSRSLHASADIFRALKSNQDEPDPLLAASIGVLNPAEGGAGGVEALVNTTAVDMLRRLPGVTEGNFRQLIAAAGSLAGLAELPVQELEKVMGGSLAARKLRDWLDATCPRQ